MHLNTQKPPRLLELVEYVGVVLAQTKEGKGGPKSQAPRLLLQEPLQGREAVWAETGCALLERHPELRERLTKRKRIQITRVCRYEDINRARYKAVSKLLKTATFN